MIRNKLVKWQSVLIVAVLSSGLLIPLLNSDLAMADTIIDGVSGVFYYWDEGDDKHSRDYIFEDADSIDDVNSSDAFGQFSITGALIDVSGNGSSFEVDEYSSQVINFSYDLSDSDFTDDADEWHLIDDNSKVIGDIQTEEKIKYGAVVVQTSLDGINWITSYEYTNALVDGNDFTDFYSTNDIQLLNGCYFRVVVAYEMAIRVVDNLVFMDEYEYKRIAEVYSFYIQTDISNNTTTINTEPCFQYSERYETGLDTGFSETNPITNDDVHSGWNLGHFVVNGYTQNQTDSEGNQIFLKNTDDRVALWFCLEQDINCLNGNEHLSISEDTNGSDERFEVQETNFRRGTLIIRFTDYQNHTHSPMIYTDFLAANASTTADTRVQLFEEGDYEVTLDYEICDDYRIDEYTNYRISFDFSIRNGDCMVFPFELTDEEVAAGTAIGTAYGRELLDGNITSNGFKLDFARSRYLTVHIERSDLIISRDTGRLQLESRENSIAHDYDIYTDEGVYTVIAINQYTGSSTTKTFYVGDDPYLIALATSGKTLDEINELLEAGAEINDLGEIIIATPTPSPTPIPTEVIESSTPMETTSALSYSEPGVVSSDSVSEETESSTTPNITLVILIALGALLIVGMIAAIGIRRSKGNNLPIETEDTDKKEHNKEPETDDSADPDQENTENVDSEESGDKNED